MKKKHLIIAFVFNLLISVGYFIENYGIGFSQLSSDLLNSVPVCYKLDDPSLFKNDLYLSDVNDVKYYTPFFIESLRSLSLITAGDYMSAINILSFLLHLIYGMSWFLLLYKLFDRFLVALFISVIIRGIVWLPGFEIWGISDIWTIMPRTMYAAFMPIPFLLLLYRNKPFFYLASFLIGFIFNFHAITGLGGILIFVLFVALYCYHNSVRLEWQTIALSLVLMVIGMLPFLSTYFVQTDSNAVYDVALYKQAFFKRIPHFFVDPAAFLQKWIAFKSLFFAVPLLSFLIYSRLFDKTYYKLATSLVLISLLTIIICSLSVYIENLINEAFKLNIRMAFQIIRAQKLAVLPGYVAAGYLLKIATDRSRVFSNIFAASVPLIVVVLFFSKAPVFKNVPFLGDDIATSIFPDYRQLALSTDEKQTPVDRMLDYINANVPADAVFHSKYIVRVGSRRSVALDTKGASMLIEGNPQRLIKWYIDSEKYAQIPDAEKYQFLKRELHVTHIMTADKPHSGLQLIHREGRYSLYKIN